MKEFITCNNNKIIETFRWLLLVNSKDAALRDARMHSPYGCSFRNCVFDPVSDINCTVNTHQVNANISPPPSNPWACVTHLVYYVLIFLRSPFKRNSRRCIGKHEKKISTANKEDETKSKIDRFHLHFFDKEIGALVIRFIDAEFNLGSLFFFSIEFCSLTLCLEIVGEIFSTSTCICKTKHEEETHF